jgi:hypothetical protein
LSQNTGVKVIAARDGMAFSLDTWGERPATEKE